MHAVVVVCVVEESPSPSHNAPSNTGKPSKYPAISVLEGVLSVCPLQLSEITHPVARRLAR